MAKIRVRNLSPWSGLDFSFQPGDILELDPEVARARIAAGLAEALERETASIEPQIEKAILPDPSPKKPKSK
jgi:hypothetical protein